MAQSSDRPEGKEHIPNYPSGFIILRVFQFVFSIVILGLISYTVYTLTFSANCLMLFTSIASVIITLWMALAHSCAPKLYNYWAVLALDIFLLVFWIISFALLTDQTVFFWSVTSGYCDYYTCYYGSLSGSVLVYGAILATACGLSALEFMFFFISLVMHSIALCRHRRTGLHSNPVNAGVLSQSDQGQMPSHTKSQLPPQTPPQMQQQVQPQAQHQAQQQIQHRRIINYQPFPHFEPPAGQNVNNQVSPQQSPQRQTASVSAQSYSQRQPPHFPAQHPVPPQFHTRSPPPLTSHPVGGFTNQPRIVQQAPPPPQQAPHQPPTRGQSPPGSY
ncbi:hypothetical protein QQX98_010469 [Neonectria punicea]|uniref:MARVEL domain-containing protein n=1 Tax=Neonectria punicea TaxID=979145 RepID=A0ABR1GPH2_9HYPO